MYTQGFSQASVSAAGMTVGLICELARTMAEQKMKSQLLQQSLSEVEGAAAQTSGQTQKDALHESAIQTRCQAGQTAASGVMTIGTEFAGGKYAASASEAAPDSIKYDVSRLETWEKKIESIKAATPELKSQAPDPKTLEKTINGLRPKLAGNPALDPNDGQYFGPEAEPGKTPVQTQFEQELSAALAIDKDALKNLKKEIRKDLEQARKAKESHESGIESTRQRWNKLGTAVSELGQTGAQAASSASKEREADARYETTQFDFLKDSLGRTNRSLDETNSSQGQSISAAWSGFSQICQSSEVHA